MAKIKMLLKNPKTRRNLIIALTCCLLAALVGGSYVGRVLYIRSIGITLIPSQDYPLLDPPAYLQKDSAWGEDTLGDSRYTMSSSGCLVTCVAQSASYLGAPVTPGELNTMMAQVGGYQGDGDLIWYKINEAVPAVDYRYSRTFSAATLESDLSQGLTPIIKVHYLGGLVQHWVLVVGALDGQFMVLDPMNADQEPIPLSDHGRVNAYRVLEKAV